MTLLRKIKKMDRITKALLRPPSRAVHSRPGAVVDVDEERPVADRIRPVAPSDEIVLMRGSRESLVSRAGRVARSALYEGELSSDSISVTTWPVDFAIFSPPRFSIPLCIQYLENGFPDAASDWAISFSWWGKMRSVPPA